MRVVLCVFLVVLLSVQTQQNLLCDPAQNFPPRITCPTDVTIAADSLSCTATVTWEESVYYPSPFFSTGVDDTADKNKLGTNAEDPHYFIDFTGTPAAKTKGNLSSFPSAECQRIGVDTGLIQIDIGTEIDYLSSIDLTNFETTNINTNVYVAVDGAIPAITLNNIEMLSNYNGDLLEKQASWSGFREGLNLLQVTTRSTQIGIGPITIIGSTEEFTLCLSGVAQPKNVGYTDDCSLGPSAFSSTHSSGTLFPIGTTIVSNSVVDSSGEISSCEFSVIVTDSSPPDIAGCVATKQVDLDVNGEATVAPEEFFTSSPSDCSGGIQFPGGSVSFDCLNIGEIEVTTVVEDTKGFQSECSTTVTVVDSSPPDIAGCMTTKQIDLDINGEATVAPEEFFTSPPSDCSGIQFPGGSVSFDCLNIGEIEVTTVVEDTKGFQSECSTTVTVVDSSPPDIAGCMTTKQIDLDINGEATVAPEEFFTSPPSDCSGIQFPGGSVSFDCLNIGEIEVTTVVEDTKGFQSECSTTVTVVDSSPPDIEGCMATKQVDLDVNGEATVAPEEFFTSPPSDCSGIQFPGGSVSFDCLNIGEIEVTTVVEDTKGFQSECRTTVTVVDSSPPDIAGCMTAKQVDLDINGEATVAPEEFFTSPPSDCSGIQFPGGSVSFDCLNIGEIEVTTVVEDTKGFQSECSTTVTVVDSSPPDIAGCMTTKQVDLDVNGEATVAPEEFFTSPPSDCSGIQFPGGSVSFDCLDIGEIEVTTVVEDTKGFQSECRTTVTVVDSSPPDIEGCMATKQVDLDINGEATVAPEEFFTSPPSDCSGIQFPGGSVSFDCLNIGEIEVTTVVEDTKGFQSECRTTVTVKDKIIPVIECNSKVSILPGEIAASALLQSEASDNCDLADISLSQTIAACPFSGTPIEIIVVATDQFNNTNSCSALVSVICPTESQTATIGTSPSPTALLSPPTATRIETQTIILPSPDQAISQTVINTAQVESSSGFDTGAVLGPENIGEEGEETLPSRSGSPSPVRSLLPLPSPTRKQGAEHPIIDDNGDIIGTVILPPEYQDHTLVIDVMPPVEETASPVVGLTLFDMQGTLISNFIEKVKICIVPDPSLNRDDTCLGFQQNNEGFTCEDSCLEETGGELCGGTDHFTSFALLLDSSSHDPDGDGCLNQANDRLFIWLSIGAILIALCFMLVSFVAIECSYRRKRVLASSESNRTAVVVL